MARTTTRRTTEPTPPAPRVREFSPLRGARVPVEFDARTAYDAVWSLSSQAGLSDDLPPEDRRWRETQIAEMRELFGESFDRFGSGLAFAFGGLVVDRPDVRTAADFAAMFSQVDGETVVRTIFADELKHPENRERMEQALAGEDVAIEAVCADADAMEPGSGLGRMFGTLLRHPEVALGPARGIVAEWADRFAAIEPRVEAMLQRDLELRAEDIKTLEPDALIEKTTGGVRYRLEPGIRRLILSPSYFTRPYNFILGGPDWRLWAYPIADAALDATDPMAPPQAVIRLHRALGDETRLRILRLLRDKDLYLTELAQLLELSKPTVKHHLTQLRAAGLVTVTEEAGLTYYSLRRDRLADATSELRRFLID
jgi:DNA-binding transcriptional ArsR family regulator